MGLDTANGRRRDLSGWNIAAALGLLAAAFLVERLVPAENEDLPERKTKRDASAVGLAAERRPWPASGVAFRDTREGMEGHPVARVFQCRGPSHSRPRRRHDVL